MAQDKQIQLEAIKLLGVYTEGFRQKLYNFQQLYIQRVRSLQDYGVPRHVAERYQYEFWKQDDHELQTMIDNIEQVDQPYIAKQIAAVEKRIHNS